MGTLFPLLLVAIAVLTAGFLIARRGFGSQQA
jgi:hypothetical protein